MPSDLAKKLAESYTDRLKSGDLQTQKFIEEQRILKTRGPKRWAELRELFKQTITGMNTELKRDAFQWSDIHTNSIRIVRKDNNMILGASFEPESQVLQFSGSAAISNMAYQIQIAGGDAQFALIRQSEAGVYTPEEIVDKILGLFVNG